MELYDFHSPEFGCSRSHREDKFDRGGCHSVDINTIVTFNGLHGLGWGTGDIHYPLVDSIRRLFTSRKFNVLRINLPESMEGMTPKFVL